jgi:CubicO group peptidase (beta-lactamase class C family)
MKTSRHSIFIIASVLFLNSAAQEKYSLTPRARKVIDSTYQSLLEKNKVAGMSLAIVDSGRIVYAAGYGFADISSKIKADENTVYRIGSCTKAFTALSVLQLEEKGLINTSQSVKRYLPELRIKSNFNDSNQIFINDMLSHVSGLPCDISNGIFCDSPPDMNWVISELNQQSTISPRHYSFAYSNVAYGLLGEVIGRTGKTTYAEYVKKNIFKPLEMRSSMVEGSRRVAGGMSKGYYYEKKELRELEEPVIRDQGAGAIRSNVLDMSNFLIMMLNRGSFNEKQIISASLIEEMEKNHVAALELPANEHYGYGVSSKNAKIILKDDTAKVHMVNHAGDTYVFHADFAYIPELKVGVVLLTNSNRGGWMGGASKLMKLYLKQAKDVKLDDKVNEEKEIKKGDRLCTGEEIKGAYNFGQFVLNVKNVKKMKFRQGSVKVVFLPKKKEEGKYVARAFLFGMVPFKVKGQEFKFVERNGKTYLKVIFTSSRNEEYIAVKRTPVPAGEAWKNALGKYMVADSLYNCDKCPVMNMKGLSMSLSEKNGFLVLGLKGKTADTKSELYLDVLSSHHAVTGGVGRGTGETVKILDNGRIYYSGYQFVKTAKN